MGQVRDELYTQLTIYKQRLHFYLHTFTLYTMSLCQTKVMLFEIDLVVKYMKLNSLVK